MKGRNKSIFVFILTLIVIAGFSCLAYLACTSVSKGQNMSNQLETSANATNVQTDAGTSETAAPSEEAGEAQAVTDETQVGEEITEAPSDEEAAQGEELATEESEEKTLAEKLFGNHSIKLGLDLQGGVNIVYEPKLDREPTEDEMAAVRTMIQKRLDAKGYTEAEVSLEGTNHVRVDIPGVEDPQKAIDEIGAAGMLRFLDQDGNEILTGTNVSKATAQYYTDNGVNKYAVGVEMDAEGTKTFSEFTASHIGQTIYILLDDTLLSAATIQTQITDGNGQITGNFSAEEAKDLADGINAGSLPFALEAVNATSVGAKLGLDALNTSLLAGMIGFAFILIFMVVMYRVCGIAADIALVLYVALLILVLSIMNTTLTLTGIAGILLSIGMAVDANVIIFVRIKEEMELGKTVRSAVDAGFDKAFSAILDGNITTLIASVVLYIFGTGLIRSFATTLGVGIVVSMFTSLVVTRLVLKTIVKIDQTRKPSHYAMVKNQSKEA